jgi:hypothetical protein
MRFCVVVKPAPVGNVRVTTSGSLPPVLHFTAPQPRPGWKAFDALRYNITAHCSDGTKVFITCIIYFNILRL